MFPGPDSRKHQQLGGGEAPRGEDHLLPRSHLGDQASILLRPDPNTDRTIPFEQYSLHRARFHHAQILPPLDGGEKRDRGVLTTTVVHGAHRPPEPDGTITVHFVENIVARLAETVHQDFLHP